MHYYALAIIPADGDVDELLDELLDPFNEEKEVELRQEEGEEPYWHNPLGLWDWWQVGGRYSGRLSKIDPQRDPRNWEICWLCEGTGKRNDALGRQFRADDPDYGCNGCEQYREITGKPGVAVKWPTSWVRNDGDIQDGLTIMSQIAELPKEALPYTVFVHGSETPVYLRERWNDEARDFENLLDDKDMRDVLARNLFARAEAGLKDRVVVIDYHS